MSAETREFSPSQRGSQRLLLPEFKSQSQPGDGMKRAGLNFSILLGATAADLVEGNLVTNLFRDKLEKRVDAMKDTANTYDQPAYDQDIAKNAAHLAKNWQEQKEKLTNAAKREQGLQGAFDFAEEWASDNLYATAANAWVRMMTGINEAKYVSETSAFLADWGNIISQVFFDDVLIGKKLPHPTINGKWVADDLFKIKWGKDKNIPNTYRHVFKLKGAYKTMDFINPVNVEAAFRLVEEIPVVGEGVHWLREKSDVALEATVGKWTNTLASKGILGFHIGRNVKQV